MDKNLPPSLECQVAQIYGTATSTNLLRVEISSVQQQDGDKDCGLFAIAFATELAFGGDLTHVQYKQDAMRDHLVRCLELKKMEPFEKLTCCGRTNIHRIVTIPLYFMCRLPESKDNMVECEQCFQWFHYSCVGVESDEETNQWSCPGCMKQAS